MTNTYGKRTSYKEVLSRKLTALIKEIDSPQRATTILILLELIKKDDLTKQGYYKVLAQRKKQNIHKFVVSEHGKQLRRERDKRYYIRLKKFKEGI